MNYVEHNSKAWDNYVSQKDRWTVPVSSEVIKKARNNEWSIILTPHKSVPANWFPDLQDLKILGLASGGGQQGPVLAALGASVTIFDNSEKQLEQDRRLSAEFNLGIKTHKGDMRNLETFENNSFDLVFNPCSILFVEEVKQVWKECFRVLKPNGILMTGLINPLSFQLDEHELKLIHKERYSDLHSLDSIKLDELKGKNEPLQFGHSWSDQISGQLEAGFVLTDMYEDNWGGENKLDPYFPSFMATRGVKNV